MKYFNCFFKKFCNHYCFVPEAVNVFCDVVNMIDNDCDFSQKFTQIRHSFMFPKAHNIDSSLEKLKLLGAEKGINEYTMNTVFLIVCSELLLKRYIRYGYSEELFWDTMADLSYKTKECMECKHIAGTFVAGWNEKFYSLERFALGRFQYEKEIFPVDCITKNGRKVKKGSTCFNFHIPSSGVSLTDDVRIDSYKKAYEFYEKELEDGVLILKCDSWLLNPRHSEFLPENSNILRFINDFDIYDSSIFETFSDGWRIFGDRWGWPIEDLPENTSLQKAYKKWLLSGNPAGAGRGVILFDGSSIIN